MNLPKYSICLISMIRLYFCDHECYKFKQDQI